jgi:hypothetical protein
MKSSSETAVGAVAQREVEGQRDRAAERIECETTVLAQLGPVHPCARHR